MIGFSPSSLLEFADSLGVFALVALLYTQVIQRTRRSSRRQRRVLLGLLFGAAAMLGMVQSAAVAPGVFVDPRHVMVALAGPFGGWLAAALATAIAVGWRAWLGGAGAAAGVAGLLLAGAAGVAVYHLGLRRSRPSVTAGMILLATLVALGTAASFLLLPMALFASVVQTWLAPVIVANGLGIILLGLFLNHELGRRRIELALARSHEELRILADNVSDMIAVVDGDGFYTYVSRSCEQLLGYTPAELVGRNVYELFHPEDLPVIREGVGRVLADSDDPAVVVYRVRRRDGEWAWVETTATLVQPRDGETERKVVTVTRDVTERQRTMSELRSQANSDELTGLANRRCFNDVGEAEFARWKRYGHPLTLMMLDLDRFKALNDAHGHMAGDRALLGLARLLRRESRAVDVVARLGGDEFAIVLPDTTRSSCEALARRIRTGIGELSPTENGAGVPLSVSIGMAEAGDDIESFHALLARADHDMYQAKHAARDAADGLPGHHASGD